ncbi:MAG: HPP family protein [Thermodesulfobacteriota bacterium]|nr:HPP family protein [Thermodesulfobacteriota bacterium]
MIQFRLGSLSRREFQRDVYGPGVISLTRIVWGSVGGGLLLFIIAFFSEELQIGVLYPPLAATCFINATCVYLRVARPKSVIVGHFVSMIGGLLGVIAGDWLFSNSTLLIAVKLGLAVLFSAMLMQIFDADHPPAAATAAIPAILPLPAPAILMPFHMAWGGVIAVLFAFAWNRIWFIWPPPDPDTTETWLGLHMEKADTIGTGICILAALLMAMKPWLETVYSIGLLIMLAGIILLATHHFFAATHQMVSSRH